MLFLELLACVFAKTVPSILPAALPCNDPGAFCVVFAVLGKAEAPGLKAGAEEFVFVFALALWFETVDAAVKAFDMDEPWFVLGAADGLGVKVQPVVV